MSRTLLAGALVAVCLFVQSPFPAHALEATQVFSAVLTAVEKGWEQALVELVAGKFFEEKPETIRETVQAKATDRSVTESAYADLPASLSLGKAGGVDWRKVAQLRQKKLGWGQIAHELGVHPGTFNKLRQQLGLGADKKGGGGIEAGPWVLILSKYYGLQPAEIEDLVRRGIPLAEVTFALNAAARSGRNVEEILRLKKQLGSWEKVAASLGLKGELLASPVDPEAKWQTALGAAPQEGGDEGAKPGKGKGKGRGKK